MNNEYVNTQWNKKTLVENKVYEDFDFSQTDFNGALFENVSFIRCKFYKSTVAGVRLFPVCKFIDCEFIKINLKNSMIGNNSGEYINCSFKMCNFSQRSFGDTDFIDSVFENCNFKGVSFNKATFRSCKFIGKLEDVTFNGVIESRDYGVLENVNFENVQFGEFVSFCKCDLTNCKFAKNISIENYFYKLYKNSNDVYSTGSADKITLTL